MQQLIMVLKSREDAQAERIRQLDGLVREWQAVFSKPSPKLLTALGVPASLATVAAAGAPPDSFQQQQQLLAALSPTSLRDRILELQEEVSLLRSDVHKASTTTDKEVMDLKMTLREAGRTVREQCALEAARLKAATEAIIAEERRLRQEAEQELAHARSTIEQEWRLKAEQAVQAAAKAAREDIASSDAVWEAKVQQLETDKAFWQQKHAGLLQELAASKQQAERVEKELRASAKAAAAEAERKFQQLQKEAAAAAQAAAEREAKLKQEKEEERTRFATAVDTSRVVALETQISYLTVRIRELQGMLQTMQDAYAERAGAAGLAAGQRGAAGGAAGKPSVYASTGAGAGGVGAAGAGRGGHGVKTAAAGGGPSWQARMQPAAVVQHCAAEDAAAVAPGALTHTLYTALKV